MTTETGTETAAAYVGFRPTRKFQPTVALSPDGSQVAYSDDASGQFNLVVQAVSGGGAARRLTAYHDSTVREVMWTPDGRSLLFLADTHGDEFNQLRRISADGGDVESLTETPQVQYALGEISPDGQLVSYAGNDAEPTRQDVLVRNLNSGEVSRVYAGGGFVFPFAWSPDSRSLTAVQFRGNTDHVVYVVPVDGGEAVRILPPGDEPALCLPFAWAPDGSSILVRTDAGREFTGVARYTIATNTLDWILTPDWDVEHAAVSRDGHTLVWTVNEDGLSRLCARNLDTGEDLVAPVLPPLGIDEMSLSADGRRVALLVVTAVRPANLLLADFDTGDVSWLTDARPVSGNASAEAELIRFPTFDGREVPAWLYRPAGPGPHGVLLSIHGGPEFQERPRYNYAGLYQYLVDRGVAVLAPNVRGSTGYGKTYQRQILRDFGGGDLRDFEAAARYLRGLDWVDPDRIGVFGGSYGGFATLSCLSRLPEYWACGVSVVGPSNLVTFAKAVPPTWRAMMAAWVGDWETEADFLMERSPITYVDDIRAPLFVIQGANDPRVVQSESDQIVEALRKRGVEVRYDVYPDEGHGFTKRENETKAIGDASEFLLAHLTR